MNERTHPLEAIAAWLLALVWLAPLAYAFWSAFHPAAYAATLTVVLLVLLSTMALIKFGYLDRRIHYQ